MILVTGGAGYIGSHTIVELITSGYSPIVYDNFSNSSYHSVKRVEKITGKKIPIWRGDIRDLDNLRSVFLAYPNIEAVFHFAGLKAVGESVSNPLRYYENNVAGTVNLCLVMKEFGCTNIVFSSSATVYGEATDLPINESFPLKASSPYGRSKIINEELLQDIFRSDNKWKIASLRYFNPVGAHESGLIGENPSGIPNNLMPYIAQVAVGKRERLTVYGGDYPTHDGTGVRDYIHVVDLAKGHVKALEALEALEVQKVITVNLGTGIGSSVLELIKAFECASGRVIPFEISDRRDGDVAECYASPLAAQKQLGWTAGLDLAKMCEDVWRWQSLNPNGY
jgi:UDP-glucose 4-epimerase